MRFNLSPVLAIIAMTIGYVAAYHADDGYDTLYARANIDALMQERDTAVSVPFQHSLRSFLEEAVAAHRRAVEVDSITDALEARAVRRTTYTFQYRRPIIGHPVKQQQLSCLSTKSLKDIERELTGLGLTPEELKGPILFTTFDGHQYTKLKEEISPQNNGVKPEQVITIFPPRVA